MDYLRKSVTMGSSGGTNPSFSNNQDIRYISGAYGTGANDHYYLALDSGTPWVKLWVDPLVFWPNSTGGPNLTNQGQIDSQIAYAKSWGLKVVLGVLPNWPVWINGVSGDPKAIPRDVSPTGPWAYFVYYLAARYNAYNPNRPGNGYGYVDVIEPFNEPNNPTFATTQSDLPERIADMMKAAKQVILSTNNTPVMAGPALQDIERNDATKDFRSFTARVGDQLLINGFYSLGNDQSFVWSVHNYSDVLYDIGLTTQYPGVHDGDNTLTRTGQVYDLLRDVTWRGWPDGGLTPFIFVTEGGGVLANIKAQWSLNDAQALTKQSVLWQNNWNRMKTSTEGRGAAMVSNYNYYARLDQPQYDCALVAAPLQGRPVYTTWKGFASAT